MTHQIGTHHDDGTTGYNGGLTTTDHTDRSRVHGTYYSTDGGSTMSFSSVVDLTQYQQSESLQNSNFRSDRWYWVSAWRPSLCKSKSDLAAGITAGTYA